MTAAFQLVSDYQPAGDQQLPALQTVAVGLANVLWLTSDVKRLGRFGRPDAFWDNRS